MAEPLFTPRIDETKFSPMKCATAGAPSVAEQVHHLEERCKALDHLSGEIIACLRVNRLRGTLTSADDNQLDAMIESWSKQLTNSR